MSQRLMNLLDAKNLVSPSETTDGGGESVSAQASASASKATSSDHEVIRMESVSTNQS